MKKSVKLLLLCLMTMTSLVIALVFAVFGSGGTEVYADVNGVSSFSYVLTGHNGYQPTDYFYDGTNKSTLVNSEIKASDKQYLNSDGTLNNSYFTINGNSTGFKSRYAFGTASVCPTSEMTAVINKGVLYARLKVGVLSLANNNRSKLRLTLSHNGLEGSVSESVTSSKVHGEESSYSPEWLYTDYIKITQDDKITFSFSSLEKSYSLSSSKFIIFEPTIEFKTKITAVALSSAGGFVTSGTAVRLYGSNAVSNINISTNYIKSIKATHLVKYVVDSGRDYCTIIGNYMYIEDEVPSGTKIAVRAYCLEDSTSLIDTVSSSQVVWTVQNEEETLTIDTDFSSPATFIGAGTYFVGETATLTTIPKTGYIFNGWTVGENTSFSSETRISIVVKKNLYIKANFVKLVSIKGITNVEKTYDGDVDVDDFDIDLVGIEEGHDTYIMSSSLDVAYASSVAGQEKKLVVSGVPELSGEDKKLYQLKTTAVPDSFGIIKQKSAVITAIEKSKVYGDVDPSFDFTTTGIVGEEIVAGELSRQEGENVGTYALTIGNIALQNPNYIFEFVGKDMTITARPLSIASSTVIPKEYDKTNVADVSVVLQNVITNDKVGCGVKATYASCNVGTDIEVVVSGAELIGDDSGNYSLDFVEIKTVGTITKATCEVEADSITCVYGDEIVLTYKTKGLFENDELSGALSALGAKNVGEYSISLGSLSNVNYDISFVSSTLKITKRTASIIPSELSKIYGEVDPLFTFTTENVLNADTISGSLLRATGENVGEYQFLIGTLADKNYDLIVVDKKFTIKKRKTNLTFIVAGKEYDGNVNTTFTYSFDNIFNGDNLTVSAQAQFLTKDAADGKLTVVKDVIVGGDKATNYDVVVNSSNLKATITRRTVDITFSACEKTYGDHDPTTFAYNVSNIVGGDVLEGAATRDVGENAGLYQIFLGSISQANNPNYLLNLTKITYFQIKPKTLKLTSKDETKFYGDADPTLSLVLCDGEKLVGEDTISTISTGELSRDLGENVGKYAISQGTISLCSNYSLDFQANAFLTIKKRGIVVNADSQSKNYGENDPVLTYTATNLPFFEEDFSIGLRRERGESVGTYEITYQSLNNPKYEITFETSLLVIYPASLTIKAEKRTKIYGDNDPAFDYSIVSGRLKNDDELNQIASGNLVREPGEDIGNYLILQGSLDFGKNYTLSYQSDNLTIVSRTIEITAQPVWKKYGEDDPSFMYEITSGNLFFDDKLEGKMERDNGEDVGEYEIKKGTISASGNYTLEFVGAKLGVLKRPITITADYVSKTYGEKEPELTYSVKGGILESDVLTGGLRREKPVIATNPKLFENVGVYEIYSTFASDNYEITFISNIMQILPKQIEIIADSKQKQYGNDEPELTCQIAGAILEGDTLDGGLYRVPGENTGVYDIRSNFNLGKNYHILFTKAYFTVTPISLVVETNDYEKIYGQEDPTFSYELIEGSLCAGDELYGTITREQGEDAGEYAIISSLYNVNYIVSLSSAKKLVITKKRVNLIANIADKVFDETTTAFVKTPVVLGLIDRNISLHYTKDNCADFVTIGPGENVPVVLHDFSLVGDKAKNYEIVYPTNLTGNITNKSIVFANITVSSYQAPTLLYGTSLTAEQVETTKEEIGLKKEVLASYNLSVQYQGSDFQTEGTLEICFDLSSNYSKRDNIFVYRKENDGTFTLLSSQTIGGFVRVSADELGTYVIVADDESWIDYAFYISITLIFAVVSVLVYLAIKKKKNDSQQ